MPHSSADTPGPSARALAEAHVEAGLPLTPDVVAAITAAPADLSYTVGCCPTDCDPAADDFACLHYLTVASRIAAYALAGWDLTQQHDKETWFEVLEWRGTRRTVVAPIYPAGHESAAEAVVIIGLRTTNGAHLAQVHHAYWVMPGLIVVSTESERHRTLIHTIQPLAA